MNNAELHDLHYTCDCPQCTATRILMKEFSNAPICRVVEMSTDGADWVAIVVKASWLRDLHKLLGEVDK